MAAAENSKARAWIIYDRRLGAGSDLKYQSMGLGTVWRAAMLAREEKSGPSAGIQRDSRMLAVVETPTMM